MARLTPEEFTEKHNRRLKGASEDIRRGIARVTVSPGSQAAKAKDLMKQRLNQAIDSGLWEKQVGKVTAEEWKTAATEKGIGRIAQGIDSARGKVQDMAAKLLPTIDAAVIDVNKIPKGGIEQSVQRAGAFMRYMNSHPVRTR